MSSIAESVDNYFWRMSKSNNFIAGNFGAGCSGWSNFICGIQNNLGTITLLTGISAGIGYLTYGTPQSAWLAAKVSSALIGFFLNWGGGATLDSRFKKLGFHANNLAASVTILPLLIHGIEWSVAIILKQL